MVQHAEVFVSDFFDVASSNSLPLELRIFFSLFRNQTTYLFIVLIVLAILPGLIRKYRVANPMASKRLLSSIPGYYYVAAACRRIGYAQTGPIRIAKFLPPLGTTLLIAAVCIGTTIWCFVIHPYYRCTREWGSPPLGVRAVSILSCSLKLEVSKTVWEVELTFLVLSSINLSQGMIANALVLFVFAFGTKVNFVTVLTHLSHDRLQIYHQWTARLCLFFSIVHTIPFILQPLKEGGSSNLATYWHSGVDYWNGTVALAALIWMVVSSTRLFRNMSYEFFVIQHILSVFIFLGSKIRRCPDYDWMFTVSLRSLCLSYSFRRLLLLSHWKCSQHLDLALGFSWSLGFVYLASME